MVRVSDEHADPTAQQAEQLLQAVRKLALELHPTRRSIHSAGLDSSLDRDFGLDSLARMELLMRLEHALDASLPEQLLAHAETPRDLLRAAQATSALSTAAGHPLRATAAPLAEANTGALPNQAQTLTDVLDWHADQHPDRVHIHLYEDGDEPQPIHYGELREAARRVAAGLLARDLQPGQCVAMMLPTGRDYFASFFGVLYAGGVPVPIYPPARPSQIEDHLRRHVGILDNARARLLITVDEARPIARLLRTRLPEMGEITTPGELLATEAVPQINPLHGDQLALLQYTSGSTGQPKGVMLSHAQLLANIRVMGEALEVDSSDVFVSWLPLYHDMGLIGAWLGTLYHAIPLVLMSPLSFLARPQRWLWAIHQHRGTISAAPNFAYELCQTKLHERDLDGLDLSSWRVAANGAEPVNPQTLHAFSNHFARYGFDAKAMMPVYGLAECSLALAFPPLDRAPHVDRVQRESLSTASEALPATVEDDDALEFVACGHPLPGYEARVVDDSGVELPERREGRLQFRGPSTTSGYFRNPEATQKLFDGDWLESGDRAYLANGDLYLTGRVKDMIIRAGRNLYPQEIEAAVGELDGVRKGCVAAFGSDGQGASVQRLVVVAETTEEDSQRREAISEQIRAIGAELLSLPPDEVVLAPPRSLLKTSSGKLRRAAIRERYEAGELGRQPSTVGWQLARLTATSLLPQWRRTRRWLADRGYALWARLMLGLFAPPGWALVMLLPSTASRWRALRGTLQLLRRCCGVPLRIRGLAAENWPAHCIVVANHASYLDVVAMIAALPQPVSFVAKGELRESTLARVFLERLGVQFVERFDQQQSIEDSRRLIDLAQRGQPLMYFPEGTFTRAPGLLPFRMGAFIAAAEAGVPVLPISIRGSRNLLRGDEWMVHRSAVYLTVGDPIQPDGTDWSAAVALRDAARDQILRHCGEPDLGHQSHPF